MSITVDFSPGDVKMIERLASQKAVSMAEYIHAITLQAVREEAELAEIDRRLEQIKQGKVVYKTMDELLEMEK